MFDCHVHSNFSTDSSMEAADACEKAASEGLNGIAFTDHMDIDYPGFDSEFMIDFSQYDSYMEKIKREYGRKLKVLKGIEIGIQPHVADASMKVPKEHVFDFVIASVHIVEGLDLYKQEYYEGKSRFQAYGRYLEEVLFMVNSIDDFDVAGHLDYVTRKACYDDRTLRYRDHIDIFDMIFKALISKGKGIEVNTSSYRDYPGIATPEYDLELLKRYKELGGEIVTLGSDSHSTEHIGYKFDYFREVLLNAGFRYAAHFENRSPVFDRL